MTRPLAYGLLDRAAVARLFTAIVVAALLALAGAGWIVASETRAPAPSASFGPREPVKWPLSEGGGKAIRDAALARARARLEVPRRPVLDLNVVEGEVTCRFIPRKPSGTSAKFHCALASGEVVKVKYGRNPEIPAEVAATRLLTALGFATDRMTIAEKVRCYGCPRSPFTAMRLLQLTGTRGWYQSGGGNGGYTDFAWAAVERKFDAPAIELPALEGWSWWELDSVSRTGGAARTDVDTLRLMAVFLAHWDNKAENQRLVCLDDPGRTDAPCARPLLLIDDLGATFGPHKANVGRWASLPVWSDPSRCTVTMKHLPWDGASFSDARLSETARRQIAEQLSALPDEQVHSLFAAVRLHEYSDARGARAALDTWTAAFRDRARQISAAGPCPP